MVFEAISEQSKRGTACMPCMFLNVLGGFKLFVLGAQGLLSLVRPVGPAVCHDQAERSSFSKHVRLAAELPVSS